MKYITVFCMILFFSLSKTALGGDDFESNKVYLNYTQEELDNNYNQSKWAPNLMQILHRYDSRSDITRKRLGQPEHFSLGEGELNGFYFYRAKNANAPIQIFIHGGAWRAGNASSYLFPAEMFLDNGISYAALDFNYVQDVGLDGMVKEIRHAISWIYENSDQLGIDRDRIFISGHSSGGHLGGVLLTTDWEKRGLPADVIKGATLLSGMYDLKAVRLSARSSYVPFTDEIEDVMSTQRHMYKINSDVILTYGGYESHEFQRQTQDFHDAMKSAGKAVDLIKFDHYNHFEVLDDFGNPYNSVSKNTLDMIKASNK